MLVGGLLYAGISQAQDAAQDSAPSSGERGAELIAATGGPAPADHLIAFAPKVEAVEARDDDVSPAAPDPADALNAAEAARGDTGAQTAPPPQEAHPDRIAG